MLNMQDSKNPFSALLGKMIVTKEGKRLGFVKDITFETKSGELISLVVKDSTPYTKNLNLERTSSNDLLVPYSAIIAIGDFVIVSEEDLI
jgi:sporulation protein YlmC with PRC-barrel domain